MSVFFPKERFYICLELNQEKAPLFSSDLLMSGNTHAGKLVWCFELAKDPASLKMHILGVPDAVEATKRLFADNGLLKELPSADEFWPVREAASLVVEIAKYAKHFVEKDSSEVIGNLFVDAIQAVYGFKSREELKLMCYAIGWKMSRIAVEGPVKGF